MIYTMNDLIRKEDAVKSLCNDCRYQPNDKDEWHCLEPCKTYVNIMCLEPSCDTNKITKQFEELAKEYPYKVIGEPDTYSEWNMAWETCCDRVEQIVRGCLDI